MKKSFEEQTVDSIKSIINGMGLMSDGCMKIQDQVIALLTILISKDFCTQDEFMQIYDSITNDRIKREKGEEADEE